jgi:hypothetical protein
MLERLFHRSPEHRVEQRAQADEKELGGVHGLQIAGHQLARPRAQQRQRRQLRAAAGVDARQAPHRRPLTDRLDTQQHHGVVNRPHFAAQRQRGRVDAAQHLQTERGILLDERLELEDGEVLAIELGEQPHVGGMVGWHRLPRSG